MGEHTILVVDDEKNTRLTLDAALSSLGLKVVTAVNGTEALDRLERDRPAVMLLDLKIPAPDGLDVLRHAARLHPEVRVIIITAHGDVDNAIAAMKLGAADFIQKPFSLQEIRGVVTAVLDREQLDAAKAVNYGDHVELAKHFINERHFKAAVEHVKRAIIDEPERPEAHNLLGALAEIGGSRDDAGKYYRIALEVDPTYRPARQNLARITRSPDEHHGPIALT